MAEDGGTDRFVELGDSISVTESAVVRKGNAAGETVGLVVSRGGLDPRVASSDVDENGHIASRIEGRASAKEKSELRSAQLLVQKLNLIGGQWQDPRLPPEDSLEEGVDATADGALDRQLKIQVTTPETQAWGVLARKPGPWTSEADVNEAVQAMFDAIQRKHLKGHPDIVLALDATDSPRFATTAVVDEFRRIHGTRARGRFDEVWVVGPVVDTVMRLDVSA